MKKAIIAVLILLVLGGGVLALTHKSNKTTPTTSNTSTTPSSSTTSTSNSSHPSASATITYSDNGFSPATLTVKSGTTVTIKNNSSSDMQMDSNPHPVHTDDPELNVGLVAAGQSATFTVTTKGTFGYHNHLDPSQGGSITVQ